MRKKKRKRIRRSLKREAILRYLGKGGLITIEKLINLLLSVGALGGAMMADKSESIKNIKDLHETFEGVDFTSPDSVYTLVGRLDRSGLIQNKNGNLKILKKGLQYLQQHVHLPSWTKKYKLSKKRSSTINLIIFDVPEKEKVKREWLRVVIKNLGYKMIQQSVWWSPYGVPLSFISDLKKYDMLQYIHLLKVYKQGSISRFLEKTGGQDYAEE